MLRATAQLADIRGAGALMGQSYSVLTATITTALAVKKQLTQPIFVIGAERRRKSFRKFGHKCLNLQKKADKTTSALFLLKTTIAKEARFLIPMGFWCLI